MSPSSKQCSGSFQFTHNFFQYADNVFLVDSGLVKHHDDSADAPEHDSAELVAQLVAVLGRHRWASGSERGL